VGDQDRYPPRQAGRAGASPRAKGKLAERLGIDTTEAFSILRSYARNRNLRLADLAQAFIDGTEPVIGQIASGSGQGSQLPGRYKPRPQPGSGRSP
jgi:hypothetical protein